MRKRGAFSLIEILVVVVVVGILATMALPRLAKKQPEAEWNSILEEVNNLVYYARQESISNQQTYRLRFQSNPTDQDSVQVEVERQDPNKPRQTIYTPVKSYYFKPVYKFPEVIMLHAVYHGKKEMLSENKNNAYCYIIPNGLVQEVLVHLERTTDEGKSRSTLKMAPFFGRFELLEGFVKHAKK